MIALSILGSVLFSNIIFGQCEDNEYSTLGIFDNIDEEIYNNDESVNTYSIYSWVSNDLNRILSGNGIPNHEVGTFPNVNNPNTISEQNVNKVFFLLAFYVDNLVLCYLIGITYWHLSLIRKQIV